MASPMQSQAIQLLSRRLFCWWKTALEKPNCLPKPARALLAVNAIRSGSPPQLVMKQTAESALGWLWNEADTTRCLPDLVLVDRDLPSDIGIAFVLEICFDQ